jgi:hypothetical protein
MTSQSVNQQKRTQSLTLTCIFTFIGSGFSAFSFFIIYLIFNNIEILPIDSNYFVEAQQVKDLIVIAGRNFFLVMLFLCITSLTGALLMWKLKKIGFHVYTIAQLLMLLIPFFMITGYTIPLPNALITAVFIGAYALNTFEMK